MSTFTENLRKQEKELNLGGNKFKFKDGDNKFRLVSEAVPHKSVYKGRETLKFVCYIIDRKDNKLKLAFLPYTIIKAIGELAINEEYAFDVLPPYDINVKAENAGTKEVNYSIIPARTNSELTENEQEMLKKQKDIRKVVEALKEKQPALERSEENEEPQVELGSEDIPF